MDTATVAVVTGASRGIGRQVALRLAAEGASIVLVARDAAALREVAKRCGPRALVVPADVSDEDAVRGMATEVARHFNGVDLLINNAAVMIPGRIEDADGADVRQVLLTNLAGPIYCMRHFLPLLRGRPRPTIVNVASLAPTAPNPGLGVYAASKAGLIAVNDALREEVRDDGIRVSVVLPGSTRTSIHGRHLDTNDDWMLDPDDVATAILEIYRAPASALHARIELRPVRKRPREHPPRR